MKNFFSILFFLCLILVIPAYTEQIEIDSEIVSVNPEHEFFIIKAGEDAGIEIGDGLIVYRYGRKIAEAHIIEVRPKVSAAEIVNLEKGKEIEEGDNILIVKEIKGYHEKPSPRAEKSKWAKILGRDSKTSVEPTTALTPEHILKSSIAQNGDVISIKINKNPDAVFSYANLVLKEEGFSISSSNRTVGIILASRPIPLSLMSELWADAVAAIDHKFVVSLDIKSEGGSSKLMASSFEEHSQKNKHIKRPVTKNTKYYNELMALVSKIKERSEY